MVAQIYRVASGAKGQVFTTKQAKAQGIEVTQKYFNAATGKEADAADAMGENGKPKKGFVVMNSVPASAIPSGLTLTKNKFLSNKGGAKETSAIQSLPIDKTKSAPAPSLQKAALSKSEKTAIMLKNKKALTKAAGDQGDFESIKRLGRVEKADRAKRKMENPDAPSFQRAAKAAKTKSAKKMGDTAPVTASTPAKPKMTKVALSKAEKRAIVLKNKKQILKKAGDMGDVAARKRLNRVEKADRDARRLTGKGEFGRARQGAMTKLRKKEAKAMA